MTAILNRLPSPAMIVACAALVVALGGVSYAAGVLPKNSVGAAQLQKKAVTASKLRTNAVTGVKVKNGSLMGADFKAGQLPAGPQGPKGDPGVPGQQGPSGAGPGYISDNRFSVVVPQNSTTTVQTLDVPAGTYLLLARAEVNNNSGSAANNIINCTLAAGTDQQAQNNLFLGPNLSIGETLPVSWQISHTFASAGQVTLSCDADAGWMGTILRPRISAIRVTSIN
jgi:hypothetical protein